VKRIERHLSRRDWASERVFVEMKVVVENEMMIEVFVEEYTVFYHSCEE
jgi:hypothetical protein